MKKIGFIMCNWLCISTSMAQTPAVALENKPHALQERYHLLKTNSETFQDYKVIKEAILDGVWKIATDSLSKREKQLSIMRLEIDSLQNKLAAGRAQLKSKSDSMAEIEYAGTHINVFGIGFSKGGFLFINFMIFVTLALVIAVLIARLKLIQKSLNETKLFASSLDINFEAYKHRALDKETKLARELQTARNKLSDLGLYK
jgi:hypothetical protein